MKKTFSLIFIFLVVVFVILFFRFKEYRSQKFQLMSFNSEYEIFNEEKVNGLDITTVINKAVSNNEKYSVQKDKDGYYNIDDDYCIEIYVSMIVDENGNTKTFRMETFNKAGMSEFISTFAEAYFKCTNIAYSDKTGKVKSMNFELLE